jgi:hypothetical protein
MLDIPSPHLCDSSQVKRDISTAEQKKPRYSEGHRPDFLTYHDSQLDMTPQAASEEPVWYVVSILSEPLCKLLSKLAGEQRLPRAD